jgi:hypothetical protein
MVKVSSAMHDVLRESVVLASAWQSQEPDMHSQRRLTVARQLGIIVLLALAPLPVRSEDQPPPAFTAQVATDNVPVTRPTDVVYGRKFGTALTMDVFLPQERANRKAIIMVCSGAWVSSRIQAAVVGAPPTDFLNYGKEGEIAIGDGWKLQWDNATQACRVLSVD